MRVDRKRSRQQQCAQGKLLILPRAVMRTEELLALHVKERGVYETACHGTKPGSSIPLTFSSRQKLLRCETKSLAMVNEVEDRSKRTNTNL